MQHSNSSFAWNDSFKVFNNFCLSLLLMISNDCEFFILWFVHNGQYLFVTLPGKKTWLQLPHLTNRLLKSSRLMFTDCELLLLQSFHSYFPQQSCVPNIVGDEHFLWKFSLISCGIDFSWKSRFMWGGLCGFGWEKFRGRMFFSLFWKCLNFHSHKKAKPTRKPKLDNLQFKPQKESSPCSFQIAVYFKKTFVLWMRSVKHQISASRAPKFN